MASDLRDLLETIICHCAASADWGLPPPMQRKHDRLRKRAEEYLREYDRLACRGSDLRDAIRERDEHRRDAALARAELDHSRRDVARAQRRAHRWRELWRSLPADVRFRALTGGGLAVDEDVVRSMEETYIYQEVE